MSEFIQDPPRPGSQLLEDECLRWCLPTAVLADVEPELTRIGQLAATDWLDLAASATEPVHVRPTA